MAERGEALQPQDGSQDGSQDGQWTDLCEDAPTPLHWIGPDGRVRHINRAALELLGYAREAVVGRHSAEFHIDQAVIEAILARLARGETLCDYEARLRRRDGSILQALVVASAYREHGTLLHTCCCTLDITERVRTEAALRDSESRLRQSQERLRLALEAGRMGTWDWNVGTGEISWSDNLEPLHGLPRGAFGGDIDAFFNIVHPADRPRVLREVTRALQEGSEYDVEFRIVWPDGSIHWMAGKGMAFRDATGQVSRMAGVGMSIDARKANEAALEAMVRENSRLAAAIENLATGVIITDPAQPDHPIIYVNPGFTAITAYSAAESVGRNCRFLQGAATDAAAVAEIRAAIAAGRSAKTVLLNYRKDGTPFWNELSLSPVFDENGHSAHFIGLVHDVTERKRAEAERGQLLADEQSARNAAELARHAAQSSEARYRFLAEAIPQIVWTAQPGGWIDYYNHRWFDYTGLSLEQTEGWGWQAVLHPDDERCRGQWLGAVQAGQPFEIECRFRRAADGVYRWHLVRAVPLHDQAQRIVKWFGTCTDIHDRKRTEEAQRLLAQASTLLASSLDCDATLGSVARLAVRQLADWCAIDVVEAEGALRRVATAHTPELAAPQQRAVAEALEHCFGHEPDAPWSVRHVLQTRRAAFFPDVAAPAPDASAPPAHQALWATLRAGGCRSVLIVPLLARDRTLGAISLALTGSATHYGRRYDAAALALAEDLAGRCAAALDNARLYHEVQEANRAKDQFMATVSHELRTPLNAMLGWTHLLRTGQLDAATQARALETIERNARAQAQLIEDVLDVSRITTGKLRLDVCPVVWAPVIEAALDSVRPAAQAKGIALRVEVHAAVGDESHRVMGDPDRLQQVIWNLLSNAIKFTPAGGRVTVELARTGETVQVTVSDTGRGISAEFLPYVFDRFRQADSSSTRQHGGLGLGLAIVRHLVELHGGTVQADSPGKDRGATFTLHLPALPEDTPAAPHSSAPAGAAAGAGVALPSGANGHPLADDARLLRADALRDVRVLVVDDEEDARELLTHVLVSCGAWVQAAASAAAALELLGQWQPHVLVSDIGLADMDGLALLRRVRALPAAQGGALPAVALTAYAAAEDRRRALDTGFQRHLAKPVTPHELVTAIAELVSGEW